MTAAFGILYSFCGFFFAYYWYLKWLVAMVLFPLMILGIERIINERKPALYIFSLSTTLLTSYYMGFMACIFAVLYFLVYYFGRYNITDTTKVLEVYTDPDGNAYANGNTYADPDGYPDLSADGSADAAANLSADRNSDGDADRSPDAGARAGDARADGSADRYPDDGPRAAGDGRNHPARRGNDGNACPRSHGSAARRTDPRTASSPAP